MKFAICNEIFQDWKLEEAMAFAKKAGYDAMEIAPFTVAQDVTKISAEKRKEIRDAAKEIGIEISGIHWVLVQTEGFHLTHPDPVVREKTSDYFCKLVDFCADIGGRFIVVGSPKQRNLQHGVSQEQAWDFATEIFRNPLAKAEQRAVTICLEPLAPTETNFINTAEEAIRFVRQFNSPQFEIILDVKAMCSETKPIAEIIRDSWPHVAYFHANDKNLKGPGFGDVDFKPIFAALKEVSYKGFVSVEVFEFEEGAELIATKSIEYLKRAFAG
jgi:sugar phosphate isomerase/epimerase